MNIAELFVKIGIAGADGVVKSLGAVGKGMTGLLDSSLAVKAGIAGMIAGLERLTGFASQVGMDLQKFNMTTGLSTDALQNWQYMGMRFDVTGKEMEQTIVGLQNSISDMMMGKGMPEGAAALGIKMTRDPFNLMTQLTKKVKELPPDVARNLVKSFGISDNVFQMMRSVDLVKDRIQKKNIIKPDEIKKLAEMNKQWKDMWFGLRTIGIKLVAEHGPKVFEELGNAVKLISDAIKWVTDLNDKFAALKITIGLVAIGLAVMFSPITAAIAGVTALIALLSDIQKYREGKDSYIGKGIAAVKDSTIGRSFSDLKNYFGPKLPAAADAAKDSFPGRAIADLKNASAGKGSLAVDSLKSMSNVLPMSLMGPTAPQPNVNVTNTYHIDGSGSPQEVAAEINKHQAKMINNAAYQFGAQAMKAPAGRNQ